MSRSTSNVRSLSIFALTAAFLTLSAGIARADDVAVNNLEAVDAQVEIMSYNVEPIEGAAELSMAKAAAEPSAESIDLATIDAKSLDVAGADGSAGLCGATSGGDASTQGTVQEWIDPSWDVDDWQIYAYAGQYVVISMNAAWGNLDSYLELYNPWGQLRAVDDDSGGNRNARIAGTFASTGYYTIRARSYAGRSTGAYTLSATSGCTPPPAAPPQSASVTVFSGPYYGGNSVNVPAGYRLSDYFGSERSIRFNGACRNAGCAVVVYRYNGWTGELYRAETLYYDVASLPVIYDNAIEYIEVYRR